jgi:hypothetical protein
MVRKALELLITKTRDIFYDIRHRVRTRDVVRVAELGLTRDSIQYEEIVPKTLRKAMVSLAPVDGYTFVEPFITDKYFRIWRSTSRRRQAT